MGAHLPHWHSLLAWIRTAALAGLLCWLAARTEIHFTSARIGTLDDCPTEMAGLACAPVAVEAILLARGQALSFKACDQFWRVDNAAGTVSALGEIYYHTGQLV